MPCGKRGEDDPLDHNWRQSAPMKVDTLVRSLLAFGGVWLRHHRCGSSLLYRILRWQSLGK
jgi:hypothetical protein